MGADPHQRVAIAPMDREAIEELVRLHVDHDLSLGWQLSPATPRAAFANDPIGTVSEVLRLAYIGAAAEAEERKGGGKPIRLVLHDARRAWSLIGCT